MNFSWPTIQHTRPAALFLTLEGTNMTEPAYKQLVDECYEREASALAIELYYDDTIVISVG